MCRDRSETVAPPNRTNLSCQLGPRSVRRPLRRETSRLRGGGYPTTQRLSLHHNHGLHHGPRYSYSHKNNNAVSDTGTARHATRRWQGRDSAQLLYRAEQSGRSSHEQGSPETNSNSNTNTNTHPPSPSPPTCRPVIQRQPAPSPFSCRAHGAETSSFTFPLHDFSLAGVLARSWCP